MSKDIYRRYESRGSLLLGHVMWIHLSSITLSKIILSCLKNMRNIFNETCSKFGFILGVCTVLLECTCNFTGNIVLSLNFG